MKALLTGYKGFIGNHIKEELENADIEVINFEGDCLNEESWHYNFCKSNVKFTYVIHCAGYNGGITFNCQYPAMIFSRNTYMALNALDMCSIYKVPYFVSFVTSCGYPTEERIGELDNTPYIEYEYLQGKPHDTIEAHGYAKRNLLLACKYYHAQYGIYPICFCPNTVFGPRDRIDDRAKVMMALIRKFLTAKVNCEKSVTVLGNGQIRREFTYVKNVSQVVANWIKNPTVYSGNGEPLNIGPSDEITIHDLVYLIADMVNYKGNVVWDINRPNGAERKSLCYNKQNMYKLNPNIQYSMMEGIDATIKWYVEEVLKESYERVIQ